MRDGALILFFATPWRIIPVDKTLESQKHGIRAAARWMIKIGRLDQFSLAQEQLARSKLPLGLDKETKNKKKGKEKRGSKKKA